MSLSHYQLLSNCTDEHLRTICARRKLPLPQQWQDGPEGRMRLLKTMVFHLEENKHLTNTLLDLGARQLQALKRLAEEGEVPPEEIREELASLGLLLPDGAAWRVPERVTDALADFDDSAFAFQVDPSVRLPQAQPYGFSLALTSVLLRCMGGIRVLKGGLPAKKELGQLLQRNALIRDERDATLVFTLLHRLGLLWNREGRVDTLLPAVLTHPPRWVPERAFAILLEHDLKLWNMPPAEDRRFFMQHLLERKGQVLAVESFLAFLQTLHPLDAVRTRTVFLPFLGRMGLVELDAELQHLTLSPHGEALTQEYLLRDHRGTACHWTLLMEDQPLVIQPTLEMLTPVVQNPHRLLRLAQVAEVETLDTMVGLRLGSDTLIRALDLGLTLPDMKQLLGGADPAGMPQPLAQLLEDLARRLGEVEVQQGCRLVKARNAALAEELRLRPELASLHLTSISDTVMEANGPGNAFALLKQAGVPAQAGPVPAGEHRRRRGPLPVVPGLPLVRGRAGHEPPPGPGPADHPRRPPAHPGRGSGPLPGDPAAGAHAAPGRRRPGRRGNPADPGVCGQLQPHRRAHLHAPGGPPGPAAQGDPPGYRRRAPARLLPPPPGGNEFPAEPDHGRAPAQRTGLDASADHLRSRLIRARIRRRPGPCAAGSARRVSPPAPASACRCVRRPSRALP